MACAWRGMLRSFHPEKTPSHQNWEVNLDWAVSVLGREGASCTHCSNLLLLATRRETWRRFRMGTPLGQGQLQLRQLDFCLQQH